MLDQRVWSTRSSVILGLPKGGMVSVCLGLPDTLMSQKKILVLSLIKFFLHVMCYYSIINNGTQVFAKLMFFTQSLEMVAWACE